MLYNVFVDPFVQMADMPDLLVQVLWRARSRASSTR